MPRLIDEAPDEEKITRSFQLEKPAGGTLTIRATYYPNRAEWTPPQAEEIEGYSPQLSDEEVVALRSCAQLAQLMDTWDMVGPWSKNGVIVGEDEMIPLTVPALRQVKPWITIQLNERIQESIYPNLRRSRESRRR